MKFFIIPLMIGLTGCAGGVDNRVFWNSIGNNNSLICKNKDVAVHMIKFGYSERSKIGQALKFRRMLKEDECFIVESQKITRTGVVHIFPLDENFPESFRGVKTKIEKVDYNQNRYWLIKTKID
jgi:hypothetical protein